MESADYAPPHVDASRPSIGFPLGTALLLIIIFSLSGIFSCCYHWEKLRSFRRSFADDLEAGADHDDDDDSIAKAKQSHLNLKQNENQSLPVLMPGDQIPKFIAMPCPCQPPRLERVVVVVESPEKEAPSTTPAPKPPRMAVPMY